MLRKTVCMTGPVAAQLSMTRTASLDVVRWRGESKKLYWEKAECRA